jgi:aromatic ring-opening dioxygenase LigB subunit
MPILKSLILPHGSNILDPEHFPAYPDCQTLHDKALEESKTFTQTEYDLIFLVTPHGHALSKSYCFYLNSTGTGNVDDTQQYASFTASVDIDTVTTQSLMNRMS